MNTAVITTPTGRPTAAARTEVLPERWRTGHPQPHLDHELFGYLGGCGISNNVLTVATRNTTRDVKRHRVLFRAAGRPFRPTMRHSAAKACPQRNTICREPPAVLTPILATEHQYRTAAIFCRAGWQLEFETPPVSGDPPARVSLAGSKGAVACAESFPRTCPEVRAKPKWIMQAPGRSAFPRLRVCDGRSGSSPRWSSRHRCGVRRRRG